MKFTSLVSPFLAWSRAAKKADTIPYPDRANPGADRYRGFHINDTEKCIGCGRCAEICESVTIDMIPIEGLETTRGDSGLRPRFDYGRCCWCALCVDVCSTGSLRMSNTYSWTTENADTCRFTPGHDEKEWDSAPKGWRQDNDLLGWAGSPREEMPVVLPDVRVNDFGEVVEGYSVEQAIEEASRCIQCGLCVTACPAHMHIPDYIRAIADGDPAEAVRLFFDNNPLPELCGKVCTRECESVCAVGYQGEAIAIRWLKRFACEQFDSLTDVLKTASMPGKPNGKKVAIIGAGPAGLAAAYYLARSGFETHVYDMRKEAGGVAWGAIPEYRLPAEGYDKQMEVFRKTGVRLHLKRYISSGMLKAFARNHDAVFIAAGLQDSSDFSFPGSDLPGVKPAFEFLMNTPENGKQPVGESVIVMGGGNVAMDTARTCRRLGADVVISYRRRIEDMPADQEEIDEAIEENVDMRTQTIPLRVETADGGLRYFYAEAEMVPSPDGGRPKPVRKDDEEHSIVADTLFLAIGQASDLKFLPKELSDQLEMKWGRIVVDENQFTGVENYFAGGDITPGVGDAITAIADGLRAAKGIRDFLR